MDLIGNLAFLLAIMAVLFMKASISVGFHRLIKLDREIARINAAVGIRSAINGDAILNMPIGIRIDLRHDGVNHITLWLDGRDHIQRIR